MAAFNKFNSFVDYWAKGQVNLGTDQIKVMLSNTQPNSANNQKYSDVSGAELAAANGYTAGGATVNGTGVVNANGTENFSAGSTTFTSNTGNMGPFRYIIYYDNTPADKPLICWFDYGVQITLNGAAGETFVLTPPTPMFSLA